LPRFESLFNQMDVFPIAPAPSLPTVRAAVWSVAALLRALADTLDARFNPVVVRGEISGFVRAASGHCYFTLKDAQGQMRCALFRRAAQLCTAPLRDGLQVELQGRVDVYGARGELQLIVETVRLSGQGNLYEQFLLLKSQLEAEGCFDPARKRSLPPFPRGIGVVTSLDAAALHDVTTTLRRRVPHLPVTLFPALVQGDAAPQALCLALQRAYAHHAVYGGVDVLLLVRGGGSLEDLWAFNTTEVVRTVIQAPMPVISGVGHETDVTLVDFAADLRAPTPTGAAERCAPGRDSLLALLQRQEQQLQQRLWQRLDRHGQTLDRLAQRLGRPSQRLALEQRQLQAWQHRLQKAVALRQARSRGQLDRLAQDWPQAWRRELRRQHQRLGHIASRLSLLDPQLVLQRGYALLSDEAGQVVTQARFLRAGQGVVAQLSDGCVDMTVRATHP